MPLNDGTANFNFYLNRQGIRGRKGEKGDPGVPVTVEVGQNTSNTFTLLITTVDGTYETPNLRGSLINTAGQGTFLMYDAENDSIYTGDAPSATDEVVGVVRLATEEEAEEGSGEGVITSEQVYSAIKNKFKSGIGINISPDDENGNMTISVKDISGDGVYTFTSPLNEVTTTTDNSNGITLNDENVGIEYETNRLRIEGDNCYICDATYDVSTGFDFSNASYIDLEYADGIFAATPSSGQASSAQPPSCGMRSGYLLGYTDNVGYFEPKVMIYQHNPSGYETRPCVAVSSGVYGQGSGSQGYDNAYFVASSKSSPDWGFHTLPAGTNYQALTWLHIYEQDDNFKILIGTWNVQRNSLYMYESSYNSISKATVGEINTVRCMVNGFSSQVETFDYNLFKTVKYDGDIPTSYDSMASTVSEIMASASNITFGTITRNKVELKYDNNTLKVNQSGQLYAASTVTIDSSLSTVSENPVQNKVITTNINSITGDISTLQTNVGNLQTTIDGGEV